MADYIRRSLHAFDKWYASAVERKSICFVDASNFSFLFFFWQTTVLANQVDDNDDEGTTYE